MNLLVGIPAYNEEATIKRVVRSIPKKIKNIDQVTIIVVNDGSLDNTSGQAILGGARVISHLINRGLGGALKTLLILAKESDADILVTFDADGQHEAKYIEKIIEPIIKRRSDIVIGSRWINNKKAPFSRILINKIANILTFILFGIQTTDSQSGFRALNKHAITGIHLTADGMEVSSEFFREIYRNHLRYSEIPINAIYTNYSLNKGQQIQNGPAVFFQLMIKYLR